MGIIEDVKPAEVLKLLAVAAWRHPNDGWARRAKEIIPNLESYLPCPGEFRFTSCCEFHQHKLECGNPTDVCTLCRKTNAEHRTAWAALE